MTVTVCVVGSANMDLVVRAPVLPRAGQTVLGGPFHTAPGGKGANQAVAAARLGARVRFVGAVGDDVHGAALQQALAAAGVDTAALHVRRGVASGVAAITVADGGANTIVVAPGANATLEPDDVTAAREAIEGADVVLLQLEIPLPSVARAAELAVRAGVPVVLNAAPATPLPESLLAEVTTLVVNEGEAVALAGVDASFSVAGIARALLPRGPGTVVVTQGARGALAVCGGDLIEQPAFAVDCVDSVAAGDAFAAAFAVARAERRDLATALRFGCAAGALATTARGAMPSLPERAAVERLAGA